jgi:hypothetical protein
MYSIRKLARLMHFNMVDNKLVWDIMVTGRKKSFLLSTKDQVKIEKYIKDFEKLKNELAE